MSVIDLLQVCFARGLGRALVLQVIVHICICANNLCLDVNISSLFYMYGKYQVADISIPSYPMGALALAGLKNPLTEVGPMVVDTFLMASLVQV